MKYIHVRNLERYHPGYKDRQLLWAKIHFSIVQGDPEIELIKNEIDKWRFVGLICLELRAQKPLPDEEKYWRKYFDTAKRPMSKTLKVLQNFLETVTEEQKDCTPEESRVEENRVEIEVEERYTSIRDHWNSTAKQHGLSPVIRLSDKRMRAVDARLKEKDFDFAKIVEEIGRSEFLRGSTGWRVDFDFVFCSANNYLKILEGKYRDAGTRKGSHGNSQLARATFTHGEQEIARLESLKETLDKRDRKRG